MTASGEGPLSRDVVDRLVAWEIGAERTDLSAMALFAAVAESRVGSQRTTLDLIRAAYMAGHEAAAIAALRAWVRSDEPDRTAQLVLCAFLLRRGDPEANAMLVRCLGGDPDRSSGWADVGDALVHANKGEAALVCYAKAPLRPELALRAGLLARELGRLAEALTWFQQTVRLDPRLERGWFLLGTCAQDTRDFGRAIDAYEHVLALNPGRTEAEVNRGMCLQAMGRLDDARGSYARAVRARPDTFGRIAQALPGSPTGELWLDLGRLRRSLAG